MTARQARRRNFTVSNGPTARGAVAADYFTRVADTLRKMPGVANVEYAQDAVTKLLRETGLEIEEEPSQVAAPAPATAAPTA